MVLMLTDLAGEQSYSVQARVQGGEAHCDELIHLDGSSRHGTQHGLTLRTRGWRGKRSDVTQEDLGEPDVKLVHYGDAAGWFHCVCAVPTLQYCTTS